MGVLLGYVWTEAVTVKIFTRFQIYTGACGRGLKSPRIKNSKFSASRDLTIFFELDIELLTDCATLLLIV